MAFYIAHTNELWTGETHTIAGIHYTGKTRMSDAKRLVEGPEPVRARTTKGSYKADNPSTPDIDESKAAPKKKRKKKNA
jgi:hypothetical protein